MLVISKKFKILENPKMRKVPLKMFVLVIFCYILSIHIDTHWSVI